MKKLTNTQKIELILEDLERWAYGGDSDDSIVYALRNGFHLLAASLWLDSGAISDEIEPLVKGVKISRKAELKEIKQLCKQAFIYVCPSCNHHGFYEDHQGDSIQCYSCDKTAFLDKGVSK